MPWYLVLLIVIAMAALPFYVFFVSKCAGAGWVAGVMFRLRGRGPSPRNGRS
jgi:hypothetical protein